MYPRELDGLVEGGGMLCVVAARGGEGEVGWQWLGLVLFGADDEAKSCLQEVCGRREAAVAPHQSSLQHVHALGGKPGARQA